MEEENNYEIPKILYDETPKARPKDVLSLIKTWDELFDIYSFNNAIYARACMHLLIGQIMVNCRINKPGTSTDPRISVLYLKPTASGGSAGYDIVGKIGQTLELKCNVITDTSDAALIGSIERHKDDEGNYEVEETKGLLDKSVSNIIYWGEASTMFLPNPAPYQQKLTSLFQSSLNPIDSVETKLEKHLKAGTAIAECEVSLLFVTYPPEEITDKVFHSGFMGRFCCIFKTLTAAERGQNAMRDAMSYAYTGKNPEFLIGDVIEMMKYIKNFVETNKRFKLTKDAAERISLIETAEFRHFEKMDTTERTRTLLSSVQALTIRKIVAIASHHAAMRFTTTIEIDDVMYAWEQCIKPQLGTMKHYLEESSQHEISGYKEENKCKLIEQKLLEWGTTNETNDIPKEEVLKIIGHIFKLTSTQSIYKRYNSLISSKTIQEKEGKIVNLYNFEVKIPK